MIKRFFKAIIETQWLRMVQGGGGKIRFSKDSTVSIAKKVTIRHCNIVLTNGSKMKIGPNAKLINANIYLDAGTLIIGDNSIIIGEHYKASIIVNKGCSVSVGHHTRISLRRIWTRFGGKVDIGNYTNFNHDGEIRADDSVSIGSYCQISQYVNVWDTNTHNILPAFERRTITEDKFPFFGFEQSKPSTSPVVIGDDCWIGERSSILKGTHIGNEVIVGYNTMLIGKTIEDGHTVVTENKLRIL